MVEGRRERELSSICPWLSPCDAGLGHAGFSCVWECWEIT